VFGCLFLRFFRLRSLLPRSIGCIFVKTCFKKECIDLFHKGYHLAAFRLISLIGIDIDAEIDEQFLEASR
jgi:hypothetical protein